MITLEQIKEWRDQVTNERVSKGDWRMWGNQLRCGPAGHADLDSSLLIAQFQLQSDGPGKGSHVADLYAVQHMHRTYVELLDEIERLHKVIADQLCENDEIGCEYTYVNVLREENKRFREAIEWVMPKVHQAYHDGYISECLKPYCIELRKALEGK